MLPTTREQFKDYCLRSLGAPVIEINVDDDQLEDRIDEALKTFWNFHADGVEKVYMSHVITANNVSDGYIEVPDAVIGINRIFPLGDAGFSRNYMFDIRYQIRLQDLMPMTTLSYVSYEMTMQHLTTLNMIFNGIPGIRFNRHTNRLYLDIQWDTDIAVGQYVIIDGYKLVDPATFSDVWKDQWLQHYTTALFKRQWGNNLKKYTNVQLPGGITLDGQTIYTEAVQEIADLNAELRDTWEEPPKFLVG